MHPADVLAHWRLPVGELRNFLIFRTRPLREWPVVDRLSRVPSGQEARAASITAKDVPVGVTLTRRRPALANSSSNWPRDRSRPPALTSIWMSVHLASVPWP